MGESYSDPLENIRILINQLDHYSKQIRFNAIGMKPSQDMESFDYIRYGSAALLSGALPNAETLAFIAFALNEYVQAEGKKTLDEAFGLKSKPKAGNPSKQFAHKNIRNSKLFDMACLRASNPEISIEEAANQVCSDKLDLEDAATLKRDYSRHKWGKIEQILKGK